MFKLIRFQLTVLIVIISSYATYAFTSSDTNFRPAGEGVNAISGWAVSNINYRLTEDTSKISAVEFDLDSPAAMVKASINSSSSAFYNCTNTSKTHWVCNTNQESLLNADTLRVIASGS